MHIALLIITGGTIMKHITHLSAILLGITLSFASSSVLAKDNTYEVSSYDEFKELIENQNGFISENKTNKRHLWCGYSELCFIKT